MRQVEGSAGLLSECRASWDLWERFSASRRGLWAMFIWSIAEATVWPIIPEFLLVPMVAGNRRWFYMPVLAAIAGAAIGGTLLYLFAFWASSQAAAYLAQLPLTGHGSVEVHQQFAEHGAAAFVYQPLSGIPFKVWAIVGGSEGIKPWQAIPIFVVARGLRMTVFATIARVAAGLFSGFFRDFSLFVLAIYLVLFFYGWWRVVSS